MKPLTGQGGSQHRPHVSTLWPVTCDVAGEKSVFPEHSSNQEKKKTSTVTDFWLKLRLENNHEDEDGECGRHCRVERRVCLDLFTESGKRERERAMTRRLIIRQWIWGCFFSTDRIFRLSQQHGWTFPPRSSITVVTPQTVGFFFPKVTTTHTSLHTHTHTDQKHTASAVRGRGSV